MDETENISAVESYPGVLVRLYGLRVHLDGSLPQFGADAAPGQAPDVSVRLQRGGGKPGDQGNWGNVLQYRSSGVDEQGVPHFSLFRTSDNGFLLDYCSGFRFAVNRRGSEVICRPPASAAKADIVRYLAGPVLGFVLRLRRICCLHASAVLIAGRAVAFAGSLAAGKSSTAAAFATLGFPVLSDDIVPLHEHPNGFLVQPGHPRLCLRPDMIPVLRMGDLPRIAPPNGLFDRSDKRYLDLTGGSYQFHAQTAPLAAVYFLGERTALDQPIIEPLSGPAAMIKLVDETFMNYLLDDDGRAAEFTTLGRLIERVPVRLVRPQSDPARLPGLCQAILADFSHLSHA